MTTLHEDGVVESVEAGQARVRMAAGAPEMCRRCEACDTAPGGTYVLHVDANGLCPGDRVMVEVTVPDPWLAIGLLFGLPLVGLVGGALSGAESIIFQRLLGVGVDTAAVIGGLAMAVFAFVLTAWETRRLLRRHPPRVTAVRRDE